MSEFPTTIILAGGLGTRLGQIGQQVPKCMMPVAGQPFVVHQLRLLKREGVKRVVFCLGHLAQQVQNFVGDGSQFSIAADYCLDGPNLLGTGGSIKKALQTCVQEKHFAVIYGDSYLDISFSPIYTEFLNSSCKGLLTVFHNENEFGQSNITWQDGKIIAYDKKHLTQNMQHIDYGLSIFDREAFAPYLENKTFDLSSVVQNLISAQELAGFEVKQRFYEIGTPDSLAETERYILQSNSTIHLC